MVALGLAQNIWQANAFSIITGSITGPGALVKLGAQQLVLDNGSSDYAGGTIVRQKQS